MRWSFKIARIAGIDLRVHATFFLLLAWIGFSAYATNRSAGQAIDAGLLTALTFGIVVLHEFGHALTAKAFGIRTHDITLLPIGGLARLERMPDKPWQELLVALAGPAVNVALFGLAMAGLHGSVSIADIFAGDWFSGGWLVRIARINLVLAVFNMIPAFPMDGGRVLRAGLAMMLEPALATMLAARLGQALAALFMFVGVLFNPLWALIGVFVWVGASAENRLAQVRAALAGISVGDAMETDVRALSPRDTLEAASQSMLRTSQSVFPVVDGSVPVGILTREDIIATMGREGPGSPVLRAMQAVFPSFAPSDPLEKAFAALQASPARAAVVVENGRLRGLLTPDDIGEIVALQVARREALKRGLGPVGPPLA